MESHKVSNRHTEIEDKNRNNKGSRQKTVTNTVDNNPGKSIITVNVNGLNTSTKRDESKTKSTNMLSIRNLFKCKDTYTLKVNGSEWQGGEAEGGWRWSK
jgi:hypothetical protein